MSPLARQATRPVAKRAAVKIQARFRCHAEVLNHAQTKAAGLNIQRMARGRQQRKHQKKQHKMATRIQAVQRGRGARKRNTQGIGRIKDKKELITEMENAKWGKVSAIYRDKADATLQVSPPASYNCLFGLLWLRH